MEILLTGISALECWRFAAHVRRLPRTLELRRALDKPHACDLRALKEQGFGFLSLPIHLLVPEANMRCRHQAVASHVSADACRMAARMGEGVFAVPPEECFLELARYFPFPYLVETGFELCGQYARAVGEFDAQVKRPPITSVAKLTAFLEGQGSVPGVRAARRALSYILDGSMSPMETVDVELLCLPVKLGGYALPFPQMNGVISVEARHRSHVRKPYYLCDLYWPEARFAIEYDSSLHHTGAARIAEDASRRIDLAYLGVEVATLTQRQAFDRREMDRIAQLLAKRLGVRLRMERIDPAGAQGSLRNQLLSPPRRDQGHGLLKDI